MVQVVSYKFVSYILEVVSCELWGCEVSVVSHKLQGVSCNL